MIKRFIKISGTGKFLNYTHASVPPIHRTTDFEKINLLYAENGSGKTTLSIILNSLKGNNAILKKKRSFDKTFPQTIEILTDRTPSPKISYLNNAWDNNYPNIEIFDIHFINENIYTGLEIQNSHKKNLFEIIFGNQGVILKQDIQVLKDNIQISKGNVKTTSSRIELLIDKAYSAIDYCNLPIDPTISTKIIAKENEIITAKSFNEIQNKPSLSKISLITLPFNLEDIKKTLIQSIDSISEEYLKKFNEHKSLLEMNGKEEEWIKQGYEAIKDETCPFCKREFDESTEIIQAYNQYFNEEYKILLKNISDFVLSTSAYNIEVQLLDRENKITIIQNLIGFWKNHLDNSPLITSISNEINDLKLAFESIKDLIKLKSHDPIQLLEISDLTTFGTLLDSLNDKLNGFNTDIDSYNSRINTLKAENRPNLAQLELQLKKLKAIDKRGETTLSTLCSSLVRENSDILSNTTQKDIKQAQLDVYSSTIFTSYATKINYYLQLFAPYLEIRDFNSAYVGSSKEPVVKYALHINGNEIKQEDSLTHPSIKYSLSEGDKSALAIAFFFTKLELSRNIQDKIIVFDDPISSFDLNRKSTTINMLVNFGQQAKQLFIFTHNIIFASEFWKSANQVSCTTQCSKIEFIGNSSCIVEYKIDTETMSSILKDSIKIKDYLLNGCYTDQERRSVARCLRPALESYFHLKFFDVVTQNDWLGNFISKVRNSSATEPFYRLQGNISELTDINNFSKKYHHRFNTNNDSEPVTDAELRNYCQKTLDLIQLI